MLSEADVQLDVRAGITSRRGSVVAGIVCGTPVAGFEAPETDQAMREAGVALSPAGDMRALAAAILKILTDERWQHELRARNTAATSKWFSWDAIAAQLLDALRHHQQRQKSAST
jgi:glycosyltransferase involved in cell wall biosynthesis